MIDALRVLGVALSRVFTHLTVSFVASITGLLLCTPLLVVLALAAAATTLSVLALGVVVLIGILPNPALTGVQATARELVLTGEVSPRESWAALRRHWRVAALTWLISLPVLVILLLNVAFYGGLLSSAPPLGAASGPIDAIWLALLVFWIALHLYVFPLLLVQERPSPWLAYRNAALMALARPGFTLVVALFWIAILIVTSSTGLVALFGLSLCAAMQQGAFLRVLPVFDRERTAS